MPKQGGDENTVFLADPQAWKFATHRQLQQAFADSTGRVWTLEEGFADQDERHFGLFDNGELIARVALLSSGNASSDCPTPFWWFGRIEVANRYQKRGIARGLQEAVQAEVGEPLASDIDQTLGGAGVWKKLIRTLPAGKIELYGANGRIGPVEFKKGAFVPNPWAKRETRLVRLPETAAE